MNAIFARDIYPCSFWWKWLLKFTRLPSDTVFCLVCFHIGFIGFGCVGVNISKVRVVFTMQSNLVRFKNVLINSNVTRGFIRKIHVDIVLPFTLLSQWFPVSTFGLVDNHVVVNVLFFLVFLATRAVTYLSTSLSQSLRYCWWEALTQWKFFSICFWVCQ